ncbi:family 20 glycosylhydrolase [Marinifilum sp. D737]|nr:family 20 glycosylhydrolase [Marinifilum sp. D737]
MKNYYLLSLVVLTVIFSVSCTSNVRKNKGINLIPYPNSLAKQEGNFKVNRKTFITMNSEKSLEIAKLLVHRFKPHLNIPVQSELTGESSPNAIHLSVDTNYNIPFEGYKLKVNEKSVTLLASSENGLFYGMQTLLQLIYIEDKGRGDIPCVQITDSPRFAWRGMHLDVSRHFMPTAFIKKYIDYLAANKLNVFHWHLVDGTGWRIEIKSHPELTDIGAWRVVKDADKPWKDIEAWKEGDDRPKYGGYYSQEEIKEIVKYAQDRFITVLPEIELPGHSEIVFDCYPQLVCKDSRGKSLKNIGVYCAANKESYQLLEDVLDEVIELFPSEYIHIGGDEVNKSNWKKCATCKNLMRKHKYDEKSLQSHFVNHFDKYLLSKGRKLIGWHEILEGDLSSSASIMYWGGMNGLEKALKEGHPTVNSTGTSYYFDHYQSSSKNELPAWGGFSPLHQVYELNPLSHISDTSLYQNVLGVQANVWTEHMKTPEKVEYMIFPRIFALAENAWTKEENKSWERFRTTVDKFIADYQKAGANCSMSAYRPIISTKLDTLTKMLEVRIEPELEAEVYYTLDGSEPTIEKEHLYTEPFLLDSTKVLKAISVKNAKVLTEMETERLIVHKARACEIDLKNQPYSKYAGKGAKTLLDLERGGKIWGNGKWLGFLNKDLDASIKLNTAANIKSVSLSCITDKGASILFPESIQVFVSKDGKSYKLAGEWSITDSIRSVEEQGVENKLLTVDLEVLNCEFVKVIATCPKQERRGTFIFIDELIVE